MTTQISSREWEALSAYLDNQLNPKERARLEKRLREDASLRSALDGLQRTRAFLQKQPKLRAPRSFTLSPEMAGIREGVKPGGRTAARRMRRPTSSAYPTLRLAFALATFFFVVVFFGDLAAHRLQPAGQAIVYQKEFVAPPAPVQGVGGGGGGGGMVEEPAAPAEPFAAPTEEAAEKAYPMAPAMPAAQALVVTPEASADMATTAPQLEAGAQGQFPMAAVQEGENVAPAPGPEREAAQNVTPSALSWSFLRIVQVLLGVLVVVSGLALLYLRRSGRE